MVVIKVDKKDKSKVFHILFKNGRFSKLGKLIFRIDENEEDALQKIKESKISYKLLS